MSFCDYCGEEASGAIGGRKHPGQAVTFCTRECAHKFMVFEKDPDALNDRAAAVAAAKNKST